MKTYSIYRYFAAGSGPVLVQSGLTLTEAQRHCNDPETSSRTASDAMLARVKDSGNSGEWFDGYREDRDEYLAATQGE